MAEKALTLRLDEAEHERLRREAFEQRTTVTALVREAIRAHIQGWDVDDSGPWPVSREARRNMTVRPESHDPATYEGNTPAGK